MTSWELIATVVTASGGAAAVILGIGTVLGKAVMDRIAEAHKRAGEIELSMRKQLLSISGEIDLDMRERRLEVYPELWLATEILPRWPRDNGMTYEKLTNFRRRLKDWYFKRGGMFMSATTHGNAYVPLQEALSDVLAQGSKGKIPKDRYDQIYDRIREKCSALRTALANDVQSRREGPV